MTAFGHKLHAYEFKIRLRILRYVDLRRCGASRLTGVLSSTKIPNDRKRRPSLYLSLSLVSCPTIRDPSVFRSRARLKIFSRYRLAKKYTCHRRDFGSDDFVTKLPFRSICSRTFSLHITDTNINVS